MLNLHFVLAVTLNIWACLGQQGDYKGPKITAEDVFRLSSITDDSHRVIRAPNAQDCIQDLYSVVIPKSMAEKDVRALFEPLADDDCQIERIFCSDLLVQVEMSVWSDETLNKIMAMEEVEFVQEVYNVTISNGWGFDRINQRTLPLDSRLSPACEFPRYIDKYTWNKYTKPDNLCPEIPNIFIVDTGIAYQHSEFRVRYDEYRAQYHYDFYGQGGWDYNGHGTHVAGIAGGNNGIAPRANLWSVRVLDGDGFGTSVAVQQGLISILNRPRKPGVVNMSFSGYRTDPIGGAFIDAIQTYYDIPVIAAAGNAATDAYDAWPAMMEKVVTVGATDRDDNMASFSNYGDAVNIFAPGVDIYSAYTTSQTRSDTYTTLNGTSMAAAHVAGVAALIKGNLPHFRAREVAIALLYNSSKNKVLNAKGSANNHLLYACIPNENVHYSNFYEAGIDYWDYFYQVRRY